MCEHDRRRVSAFFVPFGLYAHVILVGAVGGRTDGWHSFRRGKPESNDVDIVFTHPDGEKAKGLCKRTMAWLHQKGEPVSLRFLLWILKRRTM